MKPPEFLVSLFQPWNDFYSHSKTAATIVIFLHVGGLLLAGGFAIAADRATIRSMGRSPDARTAQLQELSTIHRWVITGLVLVIISGLGLLASDFENFWGSWIYWLKMALVAVLLINGLQMTRVEKALELDPSETSPKWSVLHRTAVTSLTLWFVTTFLGVALANFA
jgi:ABC-type Fe3+ transport system permease subunit